MSDNLVHIEGEPVPTPDPQPDPLEQRRAAAQAEIDQRAAQVGAQVINLFIAIRENADRCVALTELIAALQPGAKK